MIKGLIALFTSGLIVNPMVLLGIACGSVFYALLDADGIFRVYKAPSFYGLALIFGCIYILGFRRVYQENGNTDWNETLLALCGAVFKFLAASLLMISFISLFDMGDMAELNGNINAGPDGF